MSLLRTDLHCLVSSSLLPALNRFFSHHNIHRTCSLAGVLFVSNQREHVVMFCHQVLLLRTCITPPSYRDNPLLPDPVDRLEQNERFSCNSISFPTNPWFYCPTHCWATFNFFHCDCCCWPEIHLQTSCSSLSERFLHEQIRRYMYLQE